jgi:hypothetical protein
MWPCQCRTHTHIYTTCLFTRRHARKVPPQLRSQGTHQRHWHQQGHGRWQKQVLCSGIKVPNQGAHIKENVSGPHDTAELRLQRLTK